MKTSPGLLFLVGLLVLLVAALAGGQAWAMTGSTAVGLGVAAAAALLLGAGSRPVLRRLAPGGRRFFGEYRGAVGVDEFSEVAQVLADGSPRGTIRHGVGERPERVAGSVRALLADRSRGGRSAS